jgi:hypothetical protein
MASIGVNGNGGMASGMAAAANERRRRRRNIVSAWSAGMRKKAYQAAAKAAALWRLAYKERKMPCAGAADSEMAARAMKRRLSAA